MFSVRNSSFCLILLLVGLCVTVRAQDYRKLFDEHYENARSTAEKIRPLIEKLAKQHNEDPNLIESIVFPELIRYNRFYDVVEIGSLIGLYSRFGSEYADFSIGYFQMKPSFALTIEQYLKADRFQSLSKTLGFNTIDLTDHRAGRLQRVNRLEEVEWQVRYFIAMLKCISFKHGAWLKTISAKDKFIFIATAYNCGWNKSLSYIKSHEKKKFYQLSKMPNSERYNFAAIAWFRLNELKAG